MRTAFDFRRIARDALSGRWGIAMLAGLIASLLGGAMLWQGNLNMRMDEATNERILQSITGGDPEKMQMVAYIAIAVVLVGFLVSICVGSVVWVGYSRFNLDLVDGRKKPVIGTLFGFFDYWGTAVAANLLQQLYILLWSLVFIIPGIMASYSYAMTGFVLAEHPEMTANEALQKSKQMMHGNRFRLFCLLLSFFGWNLLCIFTFGIADLWILPYKQAAVAAFYRDVAGTPQPPAEK